MDGSRTVDDRWTFELFVAGDSRRSRTARERLEQICRRHLGSRYSVEVIDVLANREAARRNQILALPAVIRKAPLPEIKVIGDLSQVEKVVRGLELPAGSDEPEAAARG